MPPVGSLSELFVTHSMSLRRGIRIAPADLFGSAGLAASSVPATAFPATSATQRFVALDSADISADFPEDRTNVGIDRTYFHAAPDIEITFSLRATTDAAENIFGHSSAKRPAGDVDGKGVVPYHWWKFRAENPHDVSKYAEVVLIGQMDGWGMGKPSDDPTQPGSVDCRIISTSDENQIHVTEGSA